MAKILCIHGADLSLVGSEDMTAEELARSTGKADICASLVRIRQVSRDIDENV